MNLRKILAVVFVAGVFGAVAFAAISSNKAATNDKLTVRASFYPLYDFARQIGGNKAAVTNLTPVGAEPHDYEPSPNTLADIQEANVIVYNGGTFEPWIEKFLAGYKHTAVNASKGIALQHGEEHDHGDEAGAEEHSEEEALDPHYWLDPILAQRAAANIRDGLIAADPDNKEYYTARAKTLTDKLAQLDSAYRDSLNTCKQDTVISSHGAFSYLAERYGFHVESIAGMSPDAEPSAARLAELSNLVTQKGIGYIMFESLVSPRLADTIAQETGAKTLVFNPIEGLTNEEQTRGKDYFSIQRENIEALRTALACN